MSAFFAKKSVKICAAILLFAALVLLFLESGRAVVTKNERPFVPSYERADISHLLDGRELSDEEYELLYRQCGLTRIGVDELLLNDRSEHILKIQDDYFSNEEPYIANFGLYITSFDRMSGNYAYPELKDGDIICSFSTYLSYFEIGHAAIVIDAEQGLLAEITGYGSTVSLVPASKVFTNSTHAVLRPKCDASVRSAAAEYVKDNMLGMEYDILVGIFSRKAPESLRKTHCAHFVWYAYNEVGLDLDSTGGSVVTPRDICMSEHLELIAIRGIDPALFEK